MTRSLLALVPALALAPAAAAQLPALPGTSPGLVGPPPPLPPPVAVPGPTPTPGPPVTAPGAGFYKSGGVLVGADGRYPYDTGYYLLGGTDGLARSTGHFTMVYPEPPAGYGAGAPAGPAKSGLAHLFHGRCHPRR